MAATGTIIREIKDATSGGEKLSPAMQSRLTLAAIVELYDKQDEVASALTEHVHGSDRAFRDYIDKIEVERKKEINTMKDDIDDHDKRLEKLERHDLVEFAFKHPKLTLFIFSVIIFLIFAGKPLLTVFGVFLPQ